ncbi:hypothetical protein [Flexivirga sp. B27]
MGSIRLHRSQWWLLIPLGWVLVGIVGHWLVFPMVLLTIFIGGGFSRSCGGTRKLDRRRERLEHRQERYDARRGQWDRQHTPAQQRPVDLSKPAPAAAPQESLATLAASPRVPADVRERAQRLDRECVSTLTYLREHGAPTEQVFQVEQIHTDFGPQAVRSYLALAPGTADTTEVLDGKTGHQLIVEQLDLLLEQISAHLHRAARLGSDQLLANHRFLTEKFGHGGDSELTI